MKKIYTNLKGITLIALVITVIILLILAGITLNLTLGENGLLRRAQESANAHNAGSDNDIKFMNNAYSYMDKYFDGNNGGGENPTPPKKGLTEDEKKALADNNIKELEESEITNDNLKDNDNIKAVIEGEVPIPGGFEYKEGTKDTGVVITDGINEFVWVPVTDPNIMIAYDEATGHYSGKRCYGGALSSGTTVREPGVIISTKANYDETTTANLNYIDLGMETKYSSTSECMTQEFDKMAVSVKNYLGFFVGRFELSFDSETDTYYSKRGAIPYTESSFWIGLFTGNGSVIRRSRSSTVESQMMWGCTFDAMLCWMATGADGAKIQSNGNAAHNLSEIYETGKQTIEGKEDKVNNIYDLEGNVFEATSRIMTSTGSTGTSFSIRQRY